MKRFLKVMLEILLIFAGVGIILLFLGFSARSEIVPDIYVTSDSGKVAMAIRGGYKWNSFSDSVVADSIAPGNYVYTSNNTLLVNPSEKMVFKNSEDSWNCHKFYQLEMKYYDESNNVFEVPAPENSKAFADLKYLEIKAPEDEGTYIYNFTFSYYNKGEVSYGLKVVVSTEPNYEIEELIKYRNTNLTDAEKIINILNILPYSKYKTGIMIKLDSKLNELVINYDEFVIDRKEFTNNIIALFTLIPKLDLITYRSKTESYTFTRIEIENYVGRSLTDYSDNFELWKNEILFNEKVLDEKISRDVIYKAIIADVISEFDNKTLNQIAVDTKSFRENEILNISNVDNQEILNYVSEFSEVVYDINYEEFKKLNSNGIFISLQSLKDKESVIKEEISGDIINSVNNPTLDDKIIINENFEKELISEDYESLKNKYICSILVVFNKKEMIYKYEIEYNNEKWNITEI